MFLGPLVRRPNRSSHLFLGSCHGCVDPGTPLAAQICHPAAAFNPSMNIPEVCSPSLGPLVLHGRFVASNRRLAVRPFMRACHNFTNRFTRETIESCQFGAVACHTHVTAVGRKTSRLCRAGSLGIWDPSRQGHTMSAPVQSRDLSDRDYRGSKLQWMLRCEVR